MISPNLILWQTLSKCSVDYTCHHDLRGVAPKQNIRKITQIQYLLADNRLLKTAMDIVSTCSDIIHTMYVDKIYSHKGHTGRTALVTVIPSMQPVSPCNEGNDQIIQLLYLFDVLRGMLTQLISHRCSREDEINNLQVSDVR